MSHVYNVCSKCRKIYKEGPSIHRSKTECTWHPGIAKHVGTAGPEEDYKEVYKWSCCDAFEFSKIDKDGSDYFAAATPGCATGMHTPDPGFGVINEDEIDIKILQARLDEILDLTRLNNSKSYLFISYSRRDMSFINRLTIRLTMDKISYFLDMKDIFAGDIIKSALLKGIATHPIILLVLSPSSINSEWVQWEVEEALRQCKNDKKFIIPILINGLTDSGMPSALKPFVWVKFEEDFESPYAALRKAIQFHIDSIGEASLHS